MIFFVTENTRGRLIKRTIKRSQSVMGMLTCTGGYSKQVENYRAKNIKQVRSMLHVLKPSQNKKDQKNFPGAPFFESFLQLAAGKKIQKTVHLEIFLALLILLRLYHCRK